MANPSEVPRAAFPRASEGTPWVLLGAALTVAVLLRTIWALVTPAAPVSDFAIYRELSLSLARGQGFLLDGVATSYRPPGYPMWLAAVAQLLGSSETVARLGNVLLGAWTVVGTWLLGRRVLDRYHAGVGLLVVAVMPSVVLYTGLLASENLATALLVGILVLVAAVPLRTGTEAATATLRPSPWPGLLLAGVLTGVAILTRPVFALLLLGLPLVPGFLPPRSGLRVRASRLLLLVVPALLVVTPWTVRNQRVHRGLVPVSTNGGVNLLLSFDDRSTGRFFDVSREELEALVPTGNPPASAPSRELRIDRAAGHRARAWVAAHPLESLGLVPRKWFHLLRDDVSGATFSFKRTTRPVPGWWRPVALAVSQGAWMVILAGAGITLVRRWRRRTLGEVAILWVPGLLWLAVHAVYFGDDRFHLPLVPLLALLAADSLPRFNPPTSPASGSARGAVPRGGASSAR